MANTHLVGSVSLQSSEEVFRTAMKYLKGSMRRIPDGETGERWNWFQFQAEILSGIEGIEWGEPRSHPAPNDTYAVYPQLILTKPVAEIEIPAELRYTQPALESYQTFCSLRDEGVIEDDVRFQLCLPTPLSVVSAFLAPEFHDDFEPIYARALLNELQKVCDVVPHDDLAVQWDICVEIMMLEGALLHNFGDCALDEISDRIANLASQVPEAVELGFHLCYGDYKSEHFKEPEDLSLLVRVANTFKEKVSHSISWFHMPVPIDRSDDAYFAPLADLNIGESELYLGVVHFSDGAQGAEKRLAAANKYLPKHGHCGVGTECGMGRVSTERIDSLIKIHADIQMP